MHFRALAQHFLVLHARPVMRGAEAHGAVHQHHRQHMLDTDVRHRPVVDNCRFAGGHPDRKTLYLVAREPVLHHEGFESIQWRLNR